MITKRIPAGVYAANCYIIMDEVSKDTAVIDPGGDIEDIILAIKKMDAHVKYIFLTHGHIDHFGGVKDLLKEFNVPTLININDAKIMLDGDYIFGRIDKSEYESFVFVKDGGIYKIGETEIRCIETPGHSPGGMCYLIDNKLYSGDTLFLSSIGRTDLTGGDFHTLIDSIKSKLMVLDENIEVYPGHGGSSSIKYEKAKNPYINERAY